MTTMQAGSTQEDVGAKLPSASTTSSVKASRLRGRAFYESIGSPKMILAPMVDQSEFAWRMLSRSFLKTQDQRKLLAYTPMFHARLFSETQALREQCFQPSRAGLATARLPSEVSTEQHDYLDGRPDIDRPLTVQFCANDPDALLSAARYVQPFCDAVDLNLGCPQGIAKKGHYGAFLQEDWGLITQLISTLDRELEVPVTAKIRVLETREKTLEYARSVVDAGASILTVHGRLREQKGHLTGLANWSTIRYVRDNLPKEVVMFANGNVLCHDDIQRCLEATGVDGVMSAEGNLSDPTIFAEPPAPGEEGREYWRGRDGKGGYRMDAVFRRYLDIIYKYVLEQAPPERKPLFLPSDRRSESLEDATDDRKQDGGQFEIGAKRAADTAEEVEDRPQKRRKEKKGGKKKTEPNLGAMQPHLFNLLKPLIMKHTNVRDALARTPRGEIEAYEHVLSLTEEAVKKGLLEYESDPEKFEYDSAADQGQGQAAENVAEAYNEHESSMRTARRCKRPFWVCQPYVRPLPKEAMEKGAIQLSKKELEKLEAQKNNGDTVRTDGKPEGAGKLITEREQAEAAAGMKQDEVPKEAMVAG